MEHFREAQLNQQINSSNSDPENPFFQTHTEWTVQIENDGHALHKLVIRVLNPQLRHPIASLSFDLPAGGVYKDFTTRIGNRTLRSGAGYIQSSKTYSLSLEEAVGNSAEKIITISFRQERACVELGDTFIVIWPVGLRFHGSVTMEINLPHLNLLQLFISRIARFLDGKPPYYVIDRLELPPMSIKPIEMDPRKGIVKFVLEDGVCIPGFGFQRYSKITVTAVLAVLGAIIISVISILADLTSLNLLK